ncbi:MAG: TonB-dependent siderophore receptor [Leptolyngbya sp. SIOISBB]|nr:TonB-dependent siderophore receptor [Leptolyngbya sp. SIOISBB]
MKRLGLGLLPLSVLAWALPAGADPLLERTEPPEEATVTAAESAEPAAREARGTADATVINVADIDLTAQQEAATVPALTISDWLAQAADSAAVITAMQLQATAAGLNVILEADASLTAWTTRTVGNAQVINIPNAVLNLANADQAEQFAPTEEVALVRVSELPGGGVQISITGSDAPPQVTVGTEGGNLVVGVVPGLTGAGAGDAEAIQIGVEGEQAGSDYFVPNASTATRTDTPLSETPQSIQVIPRQVLEDQQVIELGDAVRNASGVVSSSRDQRGPRFIIRGFDSAAILRDGYRLLDAGTGNVGYQELSNIEQIEVLKGPASILSGALEPGGAINLVTKQPLSEPFYEIGVRAGSRFLVEPSIDVSGPITSDGRVLYRLNALFRRKDFYRDFDVPLERVFIAPVVSWAISDRTDLTVELEYSNETRPADFGGIPAIGDRVADIPFDRITGEPDDDTNNETLQVGYRFEHRFSNNWQIRNSFRYLDFNPEFVSNVGFQFVGDEADGNLFRVWVQNAQPIESYELQTNVVGEFTTGSIEHTLLAGVDLYRRDFRSLGRVDFTPQPLFNIFDPVYGVPRPESFNEPLPETSKARTDNLGVYVQDQITLFDNLFLLAGIRYDTVTQDSENFDQNTSDSQSDDAFTPRIGLVYQPIEEISLYGSYSTSFSPNGGTTRSGDLLDPEEGEQFEVGVRAEVLDGRLSANLALFNITKQNVATADPDALPGDNFVVATGEQRSQGVELDVIGEIMPGWNIVANYAYTDADITEDNTGLEGNRLFGVPEHNLNLWTTYEIQSGDLAGLGFGLGFNYVSERFGDNDNSFVLEDYFLTNASISYQRDNWRAGLNFRNLFDVDYIDSSEGSRVIEVRPGEGLTIIGSIAVEF